MTTRENIAHAKAIEQKNKERILAVCPGVPELSGIYTFKRTENGIRYAYVGQAKQLLTRLAQHLSGYQHIDLSLKKHGLYSEDNPTGWDFTYYVCDSAELDECEQREIKVSASLGYQLYNHTTGGQGGGKRALGEAKSPRGYRDGLAQGERNAIKKIAHLFEKHLKAVTKADMPNKTQEKALTKFYDIIQEKND